MKERITKEGYPAVYFDLELILENISFVKYYNKTPAIKFQPGLERLNEDDFNENMVTLVNFIKFLKENPEEKERIFNAFVFYKNRLLKGTVYILNVPGYTPVCTYTGLSSYQVMGLGITEYKGRYTFGLVNKIYRSEEFPWIAEKAKCDSLSVLPAFN